MAPRLAVPNALAHEHHQQRRRDQECEAEHQGEHGDRQGRLVDQRSSAKVATRSTKLASAGQTGPGPVAPGAGGDHADEARETHQASSLPATRALDAPVLREGHDMGGDEEIVEPAQGVDADQQPELARAGGRAQRQALALRPCACRRRTGGATPVARNASKTQRQQHQMREPSPQEDRAPADLGEHEREQRR